jgi:hypothetical protein
MQMGPITLRNFKIVLATVPTSLLDLFVVITCNIHYGANDWDGYSLHLSVSFENGRTANYRFVMKVLLQMLPNAVSFRYLRSLACSPGRVIASLEW